MLKPRFMLICIAMALALAVPLVVAAQEK